VKLWLSLCISRCTRFLAIAAFLVVSALLRSSTVTVVFDSPLFYILTPVYFCIFRLFFGYWVHIFRFASPFCLGNLFEGFSFWLAFATWRDMFSPPRFSFVIYGLWKGRLTARPGTMVHKQFTNGYWFMEGVDAKEPGLKRQYGVFVKFSCFGLGLRWGACFLVPFGK
jgi:hypothetical protein